MVFVGGDEACDPVRGEKPRRPGGRDAELTQGRQPVAFEGQIRENEALLGENQEASDRRVVRLLGARRDRFPSYQPVVSRFYYTNISLVRRMT